MSPNLTVETYLLDDLQAVLAALQVFPLNGEPIHVPPDSLTNTGRCTTRGQSPGFGPVVP